jgi:uncharacterized protein (TIGR02466 family)
MKEVDKYTLFPTCISVLDLERPFTKKELNKVDSLLKDENIMPNMANFTTKNKNILDESTFANLKREISQGFAHYVNQIINPINDIEIYITQSWLNITTIGMAHHLHSHANSYLSGVLYINTNEEDKIIFKRPVQSNLILSTTPKISTILNSEYWWVPVSTGQLLIFPSHLEHMVPPFGTEHKRISLSMNTYIKGKIGDEHSATFLELT